MDGSTLVTICSLCLAVLLMYPESVCGIRYRFSSYRYSYYRSYRYTRYYYYGYSYSGGVYYYSYSATAGTIAGIVIGIVVMTAVIVIIACCYKKRRTSSGVLIQPATFAPTVSPVPQAGSATIVTTSNTAGAAEVHVDTDKRAVMYPGPTTTHPNNTLPPSYEAAVNAGPHSTTQTNGTVLSNDVQPPPIGFTEPK